MKMKALFMGADQREYTSKKTGARAVAKSVSVLTDKNELIQFGYGNIPNELDIAQFEGLEKGTPIDIEFDIVGNRYRYNAPMVSVTDISTSE